MDRNINLMGNSSGAPADYLDAGHPVIVDRLPGRRDLLERHKCGVFVDGPGGVAGAVDIIFLDHGRFASDAGCCSDEVLELHRYAPCVLVRPEELEPNT